MSRIRLREADLAWRSVDDELVAIDLRASSYLTANGSGSLLWAALADGATRDELVARLVEVYGIGADAAKADVDSFLRSLAERGLLHEPDAGD